jgi:branched-chain amino acid transport system permease protein
VRRPGLLPIVVVIAALGVLAALPFLAGSSRYLAGLLNQAAFYAIVVVSLNVLLGLAGQVSLGHAGLVAVGAYTYTLLTREALWPTASVLAGVLAGTIAGCVLGVPALRMRGHYVVLGTMAFGEVVRLAVAMGSWAGGVDGLVGIPGFELGRLGRQTTMYFLLVLALMVSVGLTQLLQRSYLGKVLLAIKDDEMAAHAAGIDVNTAKLVAFGLSGAIAALGGALYAANYSLIQPDIFDINMSLLVLTMLILGGMGRTSGAIAGAVLLVFLPEMLRFSAKVYMIFYAVLVVLLSIFLPGGLIGFLSRLQPRWVGGR